MAKTSLIYIATQNPDKMGITVAEFDSATGTLSAPKMVAETRDPAHFTLSADSKHLYMCNTGTRVASALLPSTRRPARCNCSTTRNRRVAVRAT